jgi:hypothetical protein
MVVYPNEEAENGSLRFVDFVNKTFALLGNSPIKKFSLRHEPRLYCVDAYLRWIFTAMEQERGLLELHLYADRYYYPVGIERELFTSNTLVKLTLSGRYDFQVETVFLPALKSLSLSSSFEIGFDKYCNLLDGFPALEELYIREAVSELSNALLSSGTFVKCASIKRLVVFTDCPKFKEDEDHQEPCFIAPSLVYLDYSSYLSENYDLIDLNSLVEARLNLRLVESFNNYGSSDNDGDVYGWDFNVPFDYYGDVTNLVAGITNITTLHLSPDSLEVFHFRCKSIPVFNNLLLNLSIESNKRNGWQVMPLLIRSCPNLHTLVIKGFVHRVTSKCGDACACIPKKQRKIGKKEEISEYGGSFQELEQMRHFLGKLERLETVKVGVHAENNNNNEFLRANLLTLPRLSSKCNNIQFI